jgi:hypothetical protein
VADAGELGDVGVEKRLRLLACLVHTGRIRARDEVVSMFCKRLAVITNKAREHLEELREQYRAESERLWGVFGDVLAGVREALGPSDAEINGDGEVGADAACTVADPIGGVVKEAAIRCQLVACPLFSTLNVIIA